MSPSELIDPRKRKPGGCKSKTPGSRPVFSGIYRAPASRNKSALKKYRADAFGRGVPAHLRLLSLGDRLQLRKAGFEVTADLIIFTEQHVHQLELEGLRAVHGP